MNRLLTILLDINGAVTTVLINTLFWSVKVGIDPKFASAPWLWWKSNIERRLVTVVYQRIVARAR